MTEIPLNFPVHNTVSIYLNAQNVTCIVRIIIVIKLAEILETRLQHATVR